MTLCGVQFFVYKPIGDPVFLRRWKLIELPEGGGIYLHQFVRSDHDRACHDHPWNFLSIVLWGGYWEHCIPWEHGTAWSQLRTWRRPGSILYRPAIWRHRVELDHANFDPALAGTRWAERPSWSLVFVGRRRQPWGFWCEQWDGSLLWCWWRRYNTATGICEDRILHREGED